MTLSKSELLLKRDQLKNLINFSLKVEHIPELEATTNVSKLTNKIFAECEKNLEFQTKGIYKDNNFPRLIESTRKILVFLAETDNHYEKWLGYFYFQTFINCVQQSGFTIKSLAEYLNLRVTEQK